MWRAILEQSVKDYPCCCGSDDREDIDWDQIGIVPGHAYTLVRNIITVDKCSNSLTQKWEALPNA